MKRKKIPMRKCVACQEMIPKKELIRVVRNPEGLVSVDPTGKSAGRGAYLCQKNDCFQLAKKRRSLDKSLDAKISDDVYERLEMEWIELSALE